MNMIKRCVGANDELCKFPDCKCAETELCGVPVSQYKDPIRSNEMPIQFADNEIGRFQRWVNQRFGVAK